jgi:hypothetical protein
VEQLERVRRDVLAEDLGAAPGVVERKEHVPVGLGPRASRPVYHQAMGGTAKLLLVKKIMKFA